MVYGTHSFATLVGRIVESERNEEEIIEKEMEESSMSRNGEIIKVYKRRQTVHNKNRLKSYKKDWITWKVDRKDVDWKAKE